MNLSPKLVSALLVLKNHGYERVCSAVYKEGQTTYVQFWRIDELIEAQKKGVLSMRAEKPPARRPAQRALFKSNTPMWQGFATLNDMTEKDVRAGDIFKEAEQLMRSEQPIK